MRDTIVSNMFLIAWTGMLLGVVSGAVIGLFFHREDWMGGYNSFRRRLTRLGHISFFGLGFINFFFAISHELAGVDKPMAFAAAICFTVGAATMPTFCFLSAWKKPFRHFFFIPVSSVGAGIILTLIGFPR
ncbi:MAG: hypothetical protein P1U85_21330 [Verrucomicrobiales bacterium]|jgi:hypothetical protein|nr:hypothetical protein [Verrucomicrobiales bacterium]